MGLFFSFIPFPILYVCTAISQMLLDHQYGLPWHGSSVEQGWCWFIWIIKLPLILCSAHKSLAGGSNDKAGGGRLFWVIGSGGVNLSQGETQDGSV